MKKEDDLSLKGPAMRISYDPEIDALYIRLVEGPQECRTLRLTDEISLNLGPGEMLVGIEILDARRSEAETVPFCGMRKGW
jgi:uncharacterized protein YuzE